MKNFFIFFLIAISFFHTSFVSKTPPPSLENKKVLLVLWRGPTESEVTFRSTLAKLIPNVEFVEINGDQDRMTLKEVMQKEQENINNKKYDLVYTYGTTVTEFVSSFFVKNKIPIVFNIVATPVKAGLIKSMDRPGVPVTGACNGIPIEDQFNNLLKLKPIKNVLLVFNSLEKNSTILEKEIKAWGEKKAINIISHRVSPGNASVDQALELIEKGVLKGDILYFSADTFLASQMPKIMPRIGKMMPIYGATETFVIRGGTAAYAPKVEEMGNTAASIAAKILKGENASNIPVIVPTPLLIISKKSANFFKIPIPKNNTYLRD